MHHIHHTQAIVLEAEAKGESDRSLLLYTQELGLIYVLARGARNLKSKLRFSVQPYSYLHADIIATKAGWRLGSVQAMSVAGYLSMFQYSALHKIGKLIKRLCAGEEKDAALFPALLEAFEVITKADAPIDKVISAELIAVLRLLFHLGYITEGIPSAFISSPMTEEVLRDAGALGPALLRAVNQSLKETML